MNVLVEMGSQPLVTLDERAMPSIYMVSQCELPPADKVIGELKF